MVVVVVMVLGWCLTGVAMADPPAPANKERPRVRDAGVIVGVLPPGPHNAITDVAGVRVGHATLIKGDAVRTGITAVLPHSGNLFR